MHAEFNSAQIPGDYPFKTVVDNDGFLYVTGKDSNNNLLVRKYPPIENSAYVWTQSYTNSNGNDRGMNIILDTDGNAYVVGFMKNTNTGKTNATIAKVEGSDGQFIWFKIIDSMSESKVFGLTTDGSYLYAAGYYKNRLGGKDYLVVKYDLFGNRQWLRTFDNPAYHGDDVATDILVDEGYIYLMGYTYNGVSSGTDIMMVTYTKDGVMPTSQIYQKKGNEYPTGFLFTYKSDDWRAKSRTSSVGFTDNMNEHNTKDIITIAFNNDFNTSVRWVKIFDNPDTSIYSNDVATDIAVKNPYSPNQVFITGYTQTGTKGYDFVTISYDAFNGNTNWIYYYDYPSTTSGDDKSSSMLVRNDSLIISGSCEKSPNGYKTIKYALSGNNPPEQELWSNTFIPSFQIGRPVNSFSSASILHLSGEETSPHSSWAGTKHFRTLRRRCMMQTAI